MATVRGSIGAIGDTGAYAIFGTDAPRGTCPRCGCPGYHSINCPETKAEETDS